jgi:PleD family two-component response regulator
MAELQSVGTSDRLPLYVLAPDDSTKLRLQVARLPHASYFPSPYPIEAITEHIHARVEFPEGGPITALVAGKPGPVLDSVCRVARETGVAVSAVDTIESMISEVVFMQPDTVVLVNDLKDARRGDACRLLGQDASIPTMSILYVAEDAAELSVARAFAEGADQMIAAAELENLRAFLAQRRRYKRPTEHTLFRWVLAEVSRAQRLGRELSLVMFTVDQLAELRKRNQGIAVHRAVRTLASLLSHRLRHSDSLLKTSDLGFTAVLFDAGVSIAAQVSNEIVLSFDNRIVSDSDEFSLSVGIASFPEFDGPIPLLDAVERAVDRARAHAGNWVEIERK